MKMGFKFMVLALLVTSVFGDEVTPPLNKEGEAFNSRKEFYFPLQQEGSALYFTADKKKIVDVTNRDIRLISLKDKRVVKVFDIEGFARPLKLSKDGHYLMLKVSSNSVMKLALLDLEKEELIVLDEEWKEGECDSSDRFTVDMSLDGKYLVYVRNLQPFNRVMVWDIASREPFDKFSTRGSAIKKIVINGETGRVVTISNSGQADVWSIKGKHLQRFKLKDKENELVEFEISDNGKYLLMNNQITNLNSGEITVYPEYGDSFYPSLSSNSKDYIFYKSEESMLTFWDIAQKSVVKSMDMNSTILSLAISHNRNYLKVMLEDSKMAIINLENREIVKRVSEVNIPKELTISLDNNYTAMFNKDGEFLVQEFKSTKEVTKFTLKESLSISSTQLTRDGKYLVSIDSKNNVRFWDIENSMLLGSFKGSQLTDNFFITANNRYIILETLEKPIIWDIQKQKKIKSQFSLSSDFSRKMSYIHSKYLLSIAGENRIELYSIDNMERPAKEFVVGADGSWIVFDYIHKKFYRGGNSNFSYRAKVISDSLGVELLPFTQK
jgi:WD40 repeat protein